MGMRSLLRSPLEARQRPNSACGKSNLVGKARLICNNKNGLASFQAAAHSLLLRLGPLQVAAAVSRPRRVVGATG